MPSSPVAKYRSVLPAHDYAALEAWASTFYGFQHDWLFEGGRLAICNKSRQIGTSHTTAAVGVLWGAFHGELTTIISIGQLESDEVLDKCKRHAAVLRALGSTMANTIKSNSSEIVFQSGGRILALPASGGRGFSGNVFLDEFAYQEHAGKVWDNAAPVTLLGHKMRVVSTPNGIGNDYHQLWERATSTESVPAPGLEHLGLQRSAWATHSIPLSLALAQGYPVDLQHCWELAKGDPRLFEQMFNCSFLDNVLQYIPGEIIAECLTDDVLNIEAKEGEEHYAGLDIGREADLTCLIVLRLNGRRASLVSLQTMKRTDSDGLELMVAKAFAKYKLRRLCIDSTGLGTFPADRIKKQHSERIDVAHRRPRVEAISFTPNSKEALATGLYATMTGGNLRLPATDYALPGCEPHTARNLQKEIASIRRVITSSANVRYETPHTSEGHGDRAWALMLALHACSTPNPMIEALRKRNQAQTHV